MERRINEAAIATNSADSVLNLFGIKIPVIYKISIIVMVKVYFFKRNFRQCAHFNRRLFFFADKIKISLLHHHKM